MPQKYPKEFLELCRSVTAKRPKTVIDHILKHGHIATEELKEKYEKLKSAATMSG